MITVIHSHPIELMVVENILANPFRVDMLALPDAAVELHRLYQTSADFGSWADGLFRHVIDRLNWPNIVTLASRRVPANRRPDCDHLVSRETEEFAEAAE